MNERSECESLYWRDKSGICQRALQGSKEAITTFNDERSAAFVDFDGRKYRGWFARITRRDV